MRNDRSVLETWMSLGKCMIEERKMELTECRIMKSSVKFVVKLSSLEGFDDFVNTMKIRMPFMTPAMMSWYYSSVSSPERRSGEFKLATIIARLDIVGVRASDESNATGVQPPTSYTTVGSGKGSHLTIVMKFLRLLNIASRPIKTILIIVVALFMFFLIDMLVFWSN